MDNSTVFNASNTAVPASMYVHNIEDSITLSNVDPVLRIRNIYPGYRILIFNHLGSRILDPGSNDRREEKFVV
jgi:hypothetical protein